MSDEIKSNETIPGGRYLSADGVTWHDAHGNVLPAPVIAPTPLSANDDAIKTISGVTDVPLANSASKTQSSTKKK